MKWYLRMWMIVRNECCDAIHNGMLRMINDTLVHEHISMLLTIEKLQCDCSLTNDTSLYVMARIIGDVDESGMVGKAVNWSLRLMERFCLHECFEMLMNQDIQVMLLSLQMLHFQWTCYRKNQTIWKSPLERLRELTVYNLLWRRKYYSLEITNKVILVVFNKWLLFFLFQVFDNFLFRVPVWTAQT